MIKKQKDGTYTVSFSTRDKRGRKVKRQKSGISSKGIAKRTELEFIAELKAKQEGFEYSGMRFEDFLYEIFMPYCEKQYTDAEYLNYVVKKWCQSIYPIKLGAITPKDIMEILTEASPHLAFASVKKLRSYLWRIFTYALEGGLKSNPCQGVKIPKKKESTQAKVLTKEEVNLLLFKSKELKPDWHKVWTFHLFTGVRSGEGFALLKMDVDLSNMTISINKSFNSKVGIKSTKTGEWRLVPISESLKPMIVELMSDTRNGDYLLPHPYQWKKGLQARVLREFCVGLGITPIRFHDLRATFITQMFACGASIAEVQAIVGHSELKTTQVYLRLAGVGIKGATERLSFVLPSESPEKKVVNIMDRMELSGT